MISSLILRTSAPLLLWAPLLASIYILLRGHNEPGGGFIGGLLASGGMVFYAIARGHQEARRTFRLNPVFICASGILLATISGIPALLDPENAFLTHLWWFAAPGTNIALGTALIFDLGVYLTVAGSISACFLVLIEEAF